MAAFVVAVSSVRTRRASANTAMLGTVVSLASTLLVGWGLARRTAPFNASYAYFTSNVAFSGPTNFQNFEIDIVLHVDHLTVLALAVVEVCVLFVLMWHRVMGRNEPGPARFQALVSLFLFGVIGALISTDLAELFTFWSIAGGATYLMLTHRWGVDATARAGRVALALPFLTDLFLLCGIAVLYSRYGVQNLPLLIPILHTTALWTVRQLVVASVLLFIGVAGRLALWPLQLWITGTTSTAAPAASAIAQSVWPVLAIAVLYRLLPIFVASSQQAMKDIVIACGVAAVIAGLGSIFAMDPRRALALAGSAVAAIGAAITIHGFQFPAFPFAVAGVACVLAAAPARAAGMLSASAIANATRTDDMREMGDAWRRMRASAAVLLGSAIVLSLSTAGALALAVDSRSRFGVALGEALFLVALGSLRVFMAAGTGELRRRRAFDPDRVRDAAAASLGWPYWLVLVGLVLVASTFVTGWLGFLDGKTHAAAKPAAYAVWIGVVLLGFLVGALAHARSRDGSLTASGWFAAWVGATSTRGWYALDRFIYEPSLAIVMRVESWLPAADGSLGRLSVATGRLAASSMRASAAPVLVVIAVLLAVLVALLSPGVLR
ncbi:MAG TPA: proton-conducting transporter membrane subunit [Candidatus Dormibacteraeota bacterium]|nr:proton-conducting transporter membrane subunit [Candidatus Dormibacteraeota bacterium]